MNATPLISIVTPCLNRAQFIAEAVESTLRQGDIRIEHIVVDGGSTDGTLEILRQYPHLRVLSENDRGLYDALNKGIRLAQGEVIGHLNSDDLYADNILPDVAWRFASDPALDALYGGASYFAVKADGTRHIVADYMMPADIALSPSQVLLGIPIINARFFRRRVYDRVGLYNASYRFAGDREFLLRVVMAGPEAGHLARRVYWYRQHSGSLTIRIGSPHRHAIFAEHLRLAESFQCRDGVTSELRRACRSLHRRDAAEGLILSLRERRVSRAACYAWRGWRGDRAWPVALAALILPRLGAWLSRRWYE